MKDLIIWILAIGIAILWFDDNSKRSSLEQVQGQIDSLTHQRDQLQSQIGQSTAPSWFQQRLSERPTELDH